MTSASPTPLADEAATPAVQEVIRHPKQDHLEPLIRAGVITHVVAVAEALDPLFAVAQMHDLPQVQFVAAFEDGLIGLGCADGVPDELKGLATPVFAMAEPPEKLDRIDRTVQQLEYLLDALQPDTSARTDTVIEQLIDRVAALEETIRSQDHAPPGQIPEHVTEHMSALEQRIEALPDLRAELDAFATRLSQDPQVPAPLQACLDRLETGMSHLQQDPPNAATLDEMRVALDALVNRPATAPDGGINPDIISAFEQSVSTQLTDLHAKVDALAAQPAPTLDLTDQRKSFSQFATVLGMIVKRMESCSDTLTKTVSETLADQSDQDLGGQLTSLETLIKDIATSQPDIESLTAQTTRTHETVEGLATTLKDLQGEMAGLSQQPKPVLDLTEQRRSLAGFSTTLTSVAQRLEAAMDQMAQTAAPDVQPILDRIDTLANELKEAEPDPADRALLATALATLPSLKETVETRTTALAETLDSLDQKTQVLTDVTTRLDTIGAAFNDMPRASDIATECKDQMAHAMPEVLSTEMRPLVEMLTSLDAEVRSAMAHSPDDENWNDLKAQLTHLAEGMTRLPTLVEGSLAADRAETEGLVALVQTLPAILEQSVRQASDLSPISNGLTHLHQQIAALPEALNTAQLTQQIESLAQRPDPVIDLTAQHQSFARFGTAVSSVITRLEQVTEALSHASQTSPTLAPLSEALSDIATTLETHRDNQKTELGIVAEQIEALASLLDQNLPDPMPDMPDTDPGLERLRLAFAELVAAQIRQNKTGVVANFGIADQD